MTAKDYQSPKLLILLLDNDDIVKTSGWIEGAAAFDKGVEDFFGQD